MFTILVRTPEKINFQSRDLELTHGECGGGELRIENQDDLNVWNLKCKRCGMRERVKVSATGTAAISMTAVDGIDRPIQAPGRRLFFFGRKRRVMAKRID
jgi:hypothetical protein